MSINVPVLWLRLGRAVLSASFAVSLLACRGGESMGKSGEESPQSQTPACPECMTRRLGHRGSKLVAVPRVPGHGSIPMKRLIAVTLLLAVGFVAGKTAPPMIVRAQDADPFAPSSDRLELGLYVDPQPGAAATAKLRNLFLDLMARRAAEMSDDELRRQIQELTQIFAAREREADNALKHVLGELGEIVKRYPGTAAAAAAQRGLDGIHTKANDRVSNGDTPEKFEKLWDAKNAVPKTSVPNGR
ncbi:MAG: hypothetical protein ACT4QC_00120 [Planctomycetaceae bacterium]